jgi:hypothetical protein
MHVRAKNKFGQEIEKICMIWTDKVESRRGQVVSNKLTKFVRAYANDLLPVWLLLVNQ